MMEEMNPINISRLMGVRVTFLIGKRKVKTRCKPCDVGLEFMLSIFSNTYTEESKIFGNKCVHIHVFNSLCFEGMEK
jgi:hypothetical protein